MHALVTAALLITAGLKPAYGVPKDKAVQFEYLYNLADVTGAVGSTFATLAYDGATQETFVVNAKDRSVRIFNQQGMQSFLFGDDEALGRVRQVLPLPNGDLIVLSMVEHKPVLLRCNFRGEPRSRIELSGIPSSFPTDFDFDQLVLHGNALYLVDHHNHWVMVTDFGGAYRESYDLWILTGLDKEVERTAERDREGQPLRRIDNEISGFTVDRDGNMAFTISTLYAGFVVPSDGGKYRSFGGNGSRPGSFNIAGAITSDEQGTFYVADVLREVVMIFDANLEFRGEFGYRGIHRGALMWPSDLAAGDGKVFVSQGKHRGVAVFTVAPPAAPNKSPQRPGAASSNRSVRQPMSMSARPTLSLVSQNKEQNR